MSKLAFACFLAAILSLGAIVGWLWLSVLLAVS
jgi:hypothetical protein